MNNTYKDLNKDIEADLISVRSKSEIQELKYNYLKLNYEGVVKKLIDDEEKFKKKYKALNTKKGISIVAGIISGILGVSSGITLTATGVGAIAGVPIIASSGLLISIAVTIINEYISKLKERYLRLRTFTNKIRVDYEKVLKKSLADKVIDEKEGIELKKLYEFHLNNQKKIRSETKVSVEDIFGNMVDNVISNEQLQKLSSFFSKNEITISIRKSLFKKKIDISLKPIHSASVASAPELPLYDEIV